MDIFGPKLPLYLRIAPWAVILVVAIVSYWLQLRRYRLRKARMKVLQQLVHQRWMLAPGYSGDKRPLAGALQEAAAAFEKSALVTAALERLKNSGPETAEWQLREVIKAMCQTVEIDPSVLAESSLG